MSLTYAEALVELLGGKLVELYLGDQYEQVSFADNVQNTNAMMVGKIVRAVGDLLVFDAIYTDKRTKKVIHGNIIYINGYNIHCVTELNGEGTIQDAIISANSAAHFTPGGKHDKNVKPGK